MNMSANLYIPSARNMFCCLAVALVVVLQTVPNFKDEGDTELFFMINNNIILFNRL